jgi:hypothetical protein
MMSQSTVRTMRVPTRRWMVGTIRDLIYAAPLVKIGRAASANRKAHASDMAACLALALRKEVREVRRIHAKFVAMGYRIYF